MQPITLLGSLVAVVVSTTVGGPSVSSSLAVPEIRTTDLAAESCLGRPDRSVAAPVTCPGFGGFRLRVGVEGEGASLALAALGHVGDGLTLGGVDPAGRVEWHGVLNHRFEPRVVLVPLRADDGRRAVATIRLRGGAPCLAASGLADRPAVDGGCEAVAGRGRR